MADWADEEAKEILGWHEKAKEIASDLDAILNPGTEPRYNKLVPVIAAALRAERESREIVMAQAYQVIGMLLDECGKFDSEAGIRALDYFSGDTVNEDFLPWP